MKVSPCLNWLPRDSRDMFPELWSRVFRDCGPSTVVLLIVETEVLGKDVFWWPWVIAGQPVSGLNLY